MNMPWMNKSVCVRTTILLTANRWGKDRLILGTAASWMLISCLCVRVCACVPCGCTSTDDADWPMFCLDARLSACVCARVCMCAKSRIIYCRSSLSTITQQSQESSSPLVTSAHVGTNQMAEGKETDKWEVNEDNVALGSLLSLTSHTSHHQHCD